MDKLDESDIILSLLSDGIKFLDDMLNDSNKDDIHKYLDMYLCDRNIFEDGIVNFVNSLYNIKCFRLWELVLDKSSDNTILTVLSQIFIMSKDYDFFLLCF